MRIALVAPSGAMHRYNGSFSLPLHYAPLTLTTLAGLVPPELKAEVHLYDETVQAIPADLSADLVGITAITGTAPRAYALADRLRARGVLVVLGGVHPTLLPEEAALHADAVVVGYAEESWPQLLRDFARGQMQPRYTMRPDLELGGFPRPRRDLLRRWHYATLNTMEAVRGCVHPCSFCAVPAAWGRRLYRRPVREVVAEVERLPGKEVVFIDVNLIADPAYAKDLFRELAPLNKWWFGLSTANLTEDTEMFDLLVKSGCRGLLVGFESATDQCLREVHKGFHRVGTYRELMVRLHDAGIGVNGTFVFGTDAEDTSIFERTVEMVINLKIDLPRYAVVTPFPGTPLYRELEGQGRILERDWSLYDVEHCVFRPAQMTPEQLEQGLHWAWKETYKVPSILRRLTELGWLYPLGLALNWGYRLYAHRLARFTPEVMMDQADLRDQAVFDPGEVL